MRELDTYPRPWKQRAEMAEAERNQLRKANAEQAELLGLA